MATCTSIPLAIPKDGSLTKAMIKDIVGTFLTSEWPNVDPETLVVTKKTGYANTNCVVERPNPKGDTHSEPLKVFLKIHGALDGEIEVLKHLVPNKHEEAQLCYDYGQSGLGPKVYGFFQTQDGTFGRVDEFLDARSLEPEDVEDANIRAEVARGHAVFHSMETQLKKNPIQSYYDAVTRELARYHKMNKLKRLANEGGVSMDHLVDYDFVSRLRRVTDRLESIEGKKGWCIHDVQFMNVLVKNSPNQGESKIVLIDFEFVFQNYRAFDIGGHFLQKMFKWFDEENKIANCRPYTEEEKRHFCEEYSKQWNEKTGDSDTGEQVFMESELGFMLAITFEIRNMLCFMDQDGDKDPLNLLGLNKLFEEFVKQYKKLGLGS
ncbi:choline/ethanolamine kinase [Talaromyces proteolyticus]|uniref:Choline/ethanolamine kinase n=1 Tax=Talaromyces proteolyticus TaxID=1131652 RepID=A0AAD4Q063_9EURO|nr:choline/ethanolamine kinase [Talaromyces proteolyticus]KAH8700489.1 choline/ethanolamine kinase [Talaromyces proteolyticus]